MAWLEQKKSGQFLVAFCSGDEKFKRVPGTKQTKEARAATSRIEENIRLVQRGVLTLMLFRFFSQMDECRQRSSPAPISAESNPRAWLNAVLRELPIRQAVWNTAISNST